MKFNWGEGALCSSWSQAFGILFQYRHHHTMTQIVSKINIKYVDLILKIITVELLR